MGNLNAVVLDRSYLRTKARWQCILVVATGIFILFAVTIFVLTLDGSPPLALDLTPPERNIESKKNPYAELKKLNYSREDRETTRQLITDFESDRSIDVSSINELVKANRESMAKFEQVALQQPWIFDGELRMDAPWKELDTIIFLTDLFFLRALALIQDGAIFEATKDAKTLLRSGKELQDARGGMTHHLFGLYVIEKGQMVTAEILCSESLSQKELQPLSALIENAGFNSEGLKRSLRAEFHFLKNFFTGMEEGTIAGDFFESDDDIAEFLKRVNFYTFKKNQTLHLYAEVIRDLIREVDDIRNQSKQSGWKRAKKIHDFPLRTLLSKNSQGKILVSSSVETYAMICERNAKTRTNQRLLQLQAALVKYRIDHGDWPITKNNLIPDYIDSIPIDQMTGKPLGYDKWSRRIYGAGYDFKTANGIAEKPGHLADSNEPVIYLEGVPEQ